ncbi:MAG: MBL fold metallo-hydrolase [Myxococcota bacterium]
MKVTLLGHATVLVETGPMRILMDPVLRDPFESGMVVSCPKRAFDLDRLGSIDVVVVSHRHPDHFDLPSLDLLSRDCQVVCANDPLLVYALRALGFEHVTPMDPQSAMPSPQAELFPTRSENASVRECGMVICDGSAVFWNQVDTELAPDTIAEVRRRYGRVDLLFAMYASQNFDFFDSLESEFPHETHRRNLDTALSIGPRLLVPAAAGFCFAGDHAWLNPFLFPVSRERFAEDLRGLDSGISVALLDPGDQVVLSGGDPRVARAASPIATTLDARTSAIRFDPTAMIPPLRDPNPGGVRLSEMRETITSFVEKELHPHCLETLGQPGSLAARYRREGVVYGIEVIFPDDEEAPAESREGWTFDFVAQPLRLSPGLDPRANVVHRIAASALTGWIQRRLGWFSVRAYSRRYSTLCCVSRHGSSVRVESIFPPDLLMQFTIYEAADSEDAAKRRIDHEISQLRETGS